MDLKIENLTVTIRRPGATVPILKSISLDVPTATSVGLVGESGAGKSMTAYAIIRLFPAETIGIASGRILFGDVDLAAISEDELNRYRGRHIAIVFQEPGMALNPIMSIGDQVIEGIVIHHGKRGAKDRAIEALQQVGLDRSFYGRYPHQLSGGQRQRALIASAIAPGPSLLIADEPTSGLDVTVQAQILDLIHRLQQDLKMALLLITHSLGLVAQRTEHVYVMRKGEILEHGPTPQVFAAPAHPYTQMLIKMAQSI
jgi:ABC-type dipeptide/oligopeptide/nickel transport system ATPase component